MAPTAPNILRRVAAQGERGTAHDVAPTRWAPSVIGDRAERQRRRLRGQRLVGLALAVVGLGFGVTLGLALTDESRRALAAPGGIDTAVGRVAGLCGAYLMMVMVLLMARIPALERAVGQDRLTRWHRQIGGWPIALITVHVVFITFGYAESTHIGFFSQSWSFIVDYPDLLAAFAAFALLLLVGVLSVRAARRRLRYETWWAIHLYTYLALTLALFHQIATGAAFVGHPVVRILWTIAWAASAATVVLFRLALPVTRSIRHRLRVVEIREEAPGVVSVVCSGRRLDRLNVRGGQFFQWRFLTRGLWWQAHPYSLSALPAGAYLRVTVRSLGDHGASLSGIAPGTRVAIEGPYGAFTAHRRERDGVLLVGAGVGVTPLRAILEDLPEHVDVSVLVRASDESQLVLHDELTALVRERGGRIQEVFGSRHSVRFDARLVERLVPDVSERDVYVCGPEDFSDEFVAATRRLGVPDERIHRESFAF